MKSIGWSVFSVVFISAFLLSCGKDKVWEKPVAAGNDVDILKRQVVIMFEDEETREPLPGLRVLFFQRVISQGLLWRFEETTSHDGMIRLSGIDVSQPLELPRAFFGFDSTYLMPNTFLEFPESVSDPVFKPYEYWVKYKPVFSGKDSIGFRVQVPLRASLRVNFTQDTLYREKMFQSSRFRLYYSLYVVDSMNNSVGWVDSRGHDLPTDGKLLRSYSQLSIPAGRRFRLFWSLVEEEVTSYIYDDGNYRTIREGDVVLDKALPTHANTLTFHF